VNISRSVTISRSELVLAVILVALLFAIGLIVGAKWIAGTETIDSRTVPTVVTATLSTDGTAYCPDDPATPHLVPCVNRP